MRVLVAGWVGSPNAGDELLFSALRRKLERYGAAVRVVSIDPAATRLSHGVAAVGSRDLAGIARAARSADALVLGGGGLLQDETSHLNLPYHLSRVWAARAAGTPFGGVGLGAGAIGSSLARRLVRSSLKGSRGLAVRDAGSAELLRSLGFGEVVLAADLAFSLPTPDVTARDSLAVSLRSWPSGARALPMGIRWRQDLAEEEAIGSLALHLDRAAERSGLSVRFIAFHRGRDDVLHRRVAERMRSDVSFAEPDPDALPAEIGAARAIVTMRYHGAILAAMCGRPAVLVGSSAKVGSLAEELGRGAELLARHPSALASLPEAVERVLPHGPDAAAAAAQLREREAGNDRVLDRLLD